MKIHNVVLCVAIFFTSCQKDQVLPQNHKVAVAGLQITSGEICGWCAKNDTLTVNAQAAELKLYKGCDTLVKTRSMGISAQRWDSLTSTFNINDFTALNLNSCAICYDGCDSWITIMTDSLSHHIHYESGDTASIQSILPFVKELQRLTDSLGK